MSIEKFGDDYNRYMKEVPRMNFVVGLIRLLKRRKERTKNCALSTLGELATAIKIETFSSKILHNS